MTDRYADLGPAYHAPESLRALAKSGGGFFE